MFERLLAQNIEFAQADPSRMEGSLYPQEDIFEGATARKRRQEFTAGRLLAREVLSRFGIHEFPLKVGESREPLWPPGVIGSITHAKGICAVAAGRLSEIVGLGIDAERVDRLKEDILPTVCTPEELHFLNSLPTGERLSHAMLIFSAKESFYKCQYPLTRQWVGFKDVGIQLVREEKKFQILFHKELLGLPKNEILHEGRYCFENGYVATSVIFHRKTVIDSL